ncbi:MAG: hypothetical protein DMD31_00805 [Gemmatimonadetes bacterium]|nr:MAG: hypothetical protein DMD31_00805 [Gemmatimonadota bacterium]
MSSVSSSGRIATRSASGKIFSFVFVAVVMMSGPLVVILLNKQ